MDVRSSSKCKQNIGDGLLLIPGLCGTTKVRSLEGRMFRPLSCPSCIHNEAAVGMDNPHEAYKGQYRLNLHAIPGKRGPYAHSVVKVGFQCCLVFIVYLNNLKFIIVF